MNSILDRRSFLRMCSACAAFLSQATRPAFSQEQPAARPTRVTVNNRKNFVGIQVRAFAWVDEGVDQVLDNLQNKGDVNTVWAYTFGYGEERLRKDGPIPLPDHGKAETKAGEIIGGAYYDYDPKFFQNTMLKDFRATGYGKFNVIEEVAPKVKARGMDFFAWDLNNPGATLVRSIPNYSEITEVDVYGRPTIYPCFNNPDYRAYLSGKIQSLLIGYASEVDGIAWGCERMGPLDDMISGMTGSTCFCRYCQAKARDLGISVARAQAGYRELGRLFQATPERPSDGYFVSFWRLLLKYPEILSWENLWTSSFQDAQRELYGLAKTIAPQKPFGFHLMQNMTFSPFYRAEEDYSERKDYADFFKLATYNNAGGPRMAAFLKNLGRTIFHDASPEDFTQLYYKMMNYQEAPFGQLASAGLSPDYVAKETKRAVDGVQGKVKIYTGIDIDVPLLNGGRGTTDKRTSPEDVSKAIRAAIGAGADGVVLSREYVEMWLANLTSAGDTLRQVFAQSAAKPGAAN